MSPKRQVNGQEIVNDLHAGLSDTELMQKYRLSSRGLQSVFRKLLNAKAVTPADIYERSPFDDTTVDVDSISQSIIGYTALSASVYDVRNPEILGSVLDLTEQVMESRGIEAGFNETRTFIVLVGRAAKIEPILLKAKCRWCEREETTGQYRAGFDILSISPEGMKDLKKLIRALALQHGA
jgi:hypothetical protein